ncbi:hypothetical protein C8R45DRAFT_933027 [Mycena sanguinolenta]|nr:hypothetical protein C8R45DRAFT_933027 [Mycena sanguinolenta]
MWMSCENSGLIRTYVNPASSGPRDLTDHSEHGFSIGTFPLSASLLMLFRISTRKRKVLRKGSRFIKVIDGNTNLNLLPQDLSQKLWGNLRSRMYDIKNDILLVYVSIPEDSKSKGRAGKEEYQKFTLGASAAALSSWHLIAGGRTLAMALATALYQHVHGNAARIDLAINQHFFLLNAQCSQTGLQPYHHGLHGIPLNDGFTVDSKLMPKDKATTSSRAKGKAKLTVKFTRPEAGKRKGSPSASASPGSERKRRCTTTKNPTSTTEQSSTSAGSTSAGGASEGTSANATSTGDSVTASTAGQGANAAAGGDAAADDDEQAPNAKRLRNRWGIRPKEVPKEARPTQLQRAFQRFIRALCGLLTQHDVLPSAEDKLDHYNKRFDKVDNFRTHMRSLIDALRTAINEATVRATKLRKDAERISGPIANDIARIPAEYLASAFTMVLKVGLQGFCPDVDGPNTNMERRRPGSLNKSLKNSVAYKARTRLSEARFKTAHTLKVRKPVQRLVYVKEAHSDDEHAKGSPHRVREKPGRNPTATKFFTQTLDVKTEEYRKRNARPGQRNPDVRRRDDPLLPASDIGLILPREVLIDFFTPEFYNLLTVKEHARYASTGVAFPLPEYAFNPAHAHWMKMGKAEFMRAYGNEVLAQYEVPSAEEIAELSDSDADNELDEEEEIDLVDTENEMDVDVDEQEVVGMV